MGLRPHDLLRLNSPDAVDAGGAPDWVRRSLEAAPWAVARRAGANDGRIAVGIRGATRAERHPAFVAPDAIVDHLAPEDLKGREPPRKHPVFKALACIRASLDAIGLVWGPAGGAGFELATRRPALTETSDLDLIVRIGSRADRIRDDMASPAAVMPELVSGIHDFGVKLDDRSRGYPAAPGMTGEADHFTSVSTLKALAEAATTPDVRVDVLVETPIGGFALGELFLPGTEILVRTAHGPRLVPKAQLVPGFAA